MPWFRIDDNFHQHPKVQRAGNAAVGLWVRCGAWSAQYLTDGFIPDEIISVYGKPKEADACITSKLWVPAEGGVIVPDFLDYNQSKAEVDARRRRDAERKRQHRESVSTRGVPRDENGRFA